MRFHPVVLIPLKVIPFGMSMLLRRVLSTEGVAELYTYTLWHQVLQMVFLDPLKHLYAVKTQHSISRTHVYIVLLFLVYDPTALFYVLAILLQCWFEQDTVLLYSKRGIATTMGTFVSGVVFYVLYMVFGIIPIAAGISECAFAVVFFLMTKTQRHLVPDPECKVIVAWVTVEKIFRLGLVVGEKFILVAFASVETIAVYDSCVRLGSTAIRLIFRPVEDIVFLQWAAHFQTTPSTIPNIALLKSVNLLSLVILAFAPAYSSAVLFLLNGNPTGAGHLTLYAIVVCACAANGLTEAMVRAMANTKTKVRANTLWLAGASVFHVGMSFIMYKLMGAYGISLATVFSMVVRVIYSLRLITIRLPQIRFSHWWSFSYWTVLALVVGALVSLLSLKAVFDAGSLPRIGTHVLAGLIILGVVLMVIWVSERELLMRSWRQLSH